MTTNKSITVELDFLSTILYELHSYILRLEYKLRPRTSITLQLQLIYNWL